MIRHITPLDARTSCDATPDRTPAGGATPVDEAIVVAIATALALESATPLVAPPAPSGWRTAARLEGVQRLA